MVVVWTLGVGWTWRFQKPSGVLKSLPHRDHSFEEDVRAKQQTGQQSQQSEGMDKTPERSDSVMGPHSHGLLAIPETRRF